MQYNLAGIAGYGGGDCEEFVFPSEPASSLLPWNFPQAHTHGNFSTGNSIQMLEAPSWPPSALQFGFDGGAPLCSDPSGMAGLYLGAPESLIGGGGGGSFGAEFGRMNAQEMMDAKALAASKSHSEAERRRRERINTHLAKLRSLLPSTTKTDKASLLAEVIQHVKELKRQTTEIAEESPVPTESDELVVDSASDDEGRSLVRVSLCCEDRPDLLSDLIRALKSLRLRPIKAEITTLAGRVRNVIVVDSEDNDNRAAESSSKLHQSISLIHEALKAVMERRPNAEEPSSVKRQRTSSLSSILDHASI